MTVNDGVAHDYDVAIIGAGPAGAVAAALLHDRGYRVIMLEKQHFPRFSIGESLLPQAMVFLDEANLLDTVNQAGFQYKDGAVFSFREDMAVYDFRHKSSTGPAETYQVVRARFDKLLVDNVQERGVTVWYGTEVRSVAFGDDAIVLAYARDTGEEGRISARFCLDASGFAKVLPRLLQLERPSDFPTRQSYYTHIRDNITDASFDRDRILITVHPECKDIWYWLIPFSGGISSIGVVAESRFLADSGAEDNAGVLKHFLYADPYLARILSQAEFMNPVQTIKGYASSVSTLHGDRFALLGNAGEFLDPVFSSGVTIAMKSASLAADVLDRQLKGEEVDWEEDFAQPLMYGVNTFKAFVHAWYQGDLLDIFYPATPEDPMVRKHICSILAGYAWDEANPYTGRHAARRIRILAEVCR